MDHGAHQRVALVRHGGETVEHRKAVKGIADVEADDERRNVRVCRAGAHPIDEQELQRTRNKESAARAGPQPGHLKPAMERQQNSGRETHRGVAGQDGQGDNKRLPHDTWLFAYRVHQNKYPARCPNTTPNM